MSSLAQLAAKHECAIVVIGYMNKSVGVKSLYRGLGSIDITATARSILLVSRLEDNSVTRVISHIKSSLAKEGERLAFEIGETSTINFLQDFDFTAVDSRLDDTSTYESGKRELAAEMIAELLCMVQGNVAKFTPFARKWASAKEQ